ncbi:MAG: phytanoyl-CoA dioxygenase family protein [Pseudomonadota bacterium]|nr:phytanoyl-CoA dioxygenase family protein [Pseudomonadota bacterium]
MFYKTQVERYREMGFAVLKNAFEPTLVESVFNEVCDVFRPILKYHGIVSPEIIGDEFEDALAKLFCQDMSAYLSTAKAVQLTPGLHALGAHPTMINLVRSFGIAQPLIAVRPVVHILSDKLRVNQGYHRTPPHQDWRSVQGSLDSLVVWLPLVSINRGFGAMEVIPGSHLEGLLETRRDPFGNVIDASLIDGKRFVPVEVDPGDAIVFSMFTVHRTGTEQRSGIRWAASFRYNNAAAPDYVSHGYPDPFIYKSQDELLIDGFPTLEEVRATFLKLD